MDRNEPPAHLTAEERAWLQGEMDEEENVTILPPYGRTVPAALSPTAPDDADDDDLLSVSLSPTASASWSSSPSGEMPDEEAEVVQRRPNEQHERQRAYYAAREAANSKARALLVAAIGEESVRTMEAGGTYVIHSTRWPGTEYHIPKVGEIKIVRGGLWQNVCIVADRYDLPWADVALARIKTIETNETIVQARGNLMRGTKNRVLDKVAKAIEEALRRR